MSERRLHVSGLLAGVMVENMLWQNWPHIAPLLSILAISAWAGYVLPDDIRAIYRRFAKRKHGRTPP